jgi:hypothetical protein
MSGIQHYFLVIINVFDRRYGEMWSDYVGQYATRNEASVQGFDYINSLKMELIKEGPYKTVEEVMVDFRIESQMFEIGSF